MNKLLLLFIILSIGCQNNDKQKKVQLTGEAQGTYYSIVYFDNEARDFQYEIDSILKDFDQSVSLWVPNSILSRINNNEANVSLDSYFTENFKISKDVAKKTDGAFDFTIGTLIKAWGFGFDGTKTIEDTEIEGLLRITGYNKVSIENGIVIKENPNVSFDFNAVAQGYSVDVVGEFLQGKGINNYLIDIGGEVKAQGSKPNDDKWKVGIEKPAKEQSDSRDLKAIVELTDVSIATSGNYRKFYEEDGIRYSHTINPKTGYPARNRLLSVSVLHQSTAYADAYATAFMVMGYMDAKSFVEDNNEIEAFFIISSENGSYETYATKGFTESITQEFE